MPSKINNPSSPPQVGSDDPPQPSPPPVAVFRQTEASGSFTAAHPVPARHHVEANPTGKRLAVLSLAALGVVYGDIGTSPLYAMAACFSHEYGLAATRANVYGVLSLILWSLILIVSIKYLVFVMRADNGGQGGILALLALLLQQHRRDGDRHQRAALVAVGLFGAALLYGDGVITPAISVLGAIGGVKVAVPSIPAGVVVVATLVILFGLFSLQHYGTASVGRLFGPIVFVWFIMLAALGIHEIALEPHILLAINPWYGVQFFVVHRLSGFMALGAIVLVVTGAEALYADMGHFGRRPIQLAWFSLVLPALVLNYFGQGALLLREPAAFDNPFFKLAPPALLWPLLIVATLAAIVASQALISGAFSLTQQSVQLGYCPRVTIVHTSYTEAGQIYIPGVNWLLAAGCFLVVLVFQNADALGAAYGIAVTGTMVITTVLFYVIARWRWNWAPLRIIPLTALFLAVDLAFMSANMVKITHKGWVPLLVALGVYILMSTWKRGRLMLTEILQAGSLPLDLFLKDVERRNPPRVPGTAVFMTSTPDGVPLVLLHHLKHNKVLHAQVILMSVITKEVPEILAAERVTVEGLDHGFYRVMAQYGFMETPNVPEVLAHARAAGIKAPANDTTFYLGRERIIVAGSHGSGKAGSRRAPEGTAQPRHARWRKRLFVVMARNARSATEFFGIPPNRVVELGAQVEF